MNLEGYETDTEENEVSVQPRSETTIDLKVQRL